ncbi:hypothetical protein FSP39_002867 [Pinctada imbricata]|uniref:SOCS box domain-containing protein n=1 Tax=Pinctada imbricata TaxID=66713 RepID=A0AA88XKP0_PINIB|nr:hypothetical protein FSP39_002867 [Pinctada imbricata]
MSTSLKGLSEAVLNHDLEGIKRFLRVHMDHGCLDHGTLSEALLEAAKKGMFEIVEFILRSSDDVDINYTNSNGRNALCMSIKAGDLNVVKLLVEKGASVNVNEANMNCFDTNPLHLATECDDVNILEFLLRNGANVNSMDKLGCSALHRAIKSKNVDKVKILLENGADLKPMEYFEMTPLCSAVMMESPEIVQLLLNAGADPNDTDLSGMEMGSYRCSLLHTAQMLKESSFEKSSTILQMLIESGARLNQEDSYGYTPIQHCIKRCKTKAFNMTNLILLIKAGAKLESVERVSYYKSISLESSLYLLQCYRQWDVIRLLVDAGWELHREPCMDIVLENAQERNTEIYDDIKALHSHPYPLMSLCRIAIKRHLLRCTHDRSIYTRVLELPLPRKLRDFVMGVT